MNKSPLYTAISVIAVLAMACDSGIPTVSLGLDEVYFVPRMQKLDLHPALTGQSYRWTMTDSDGNVAVLSTERDYIFIAKDEGAYKLSFDILDPSTPYHFDFVVNVLHEEVEYSPYIAKVLEYCPAPGQFVNDMPKYEDGDTYEDILRKAEESVSGTNDVMISLGGYGGYVTFAFDHTVINVPGEFDFRIWGNCFYELTDPDGKGGSAEPGIVMVSYDYNCNGLPDDEWFEIAGSEYGSDRTVHNYSVTYRRNDPSKIPVPDPTGMLTDTEYIPWTDSEGKNGFIAKNIFHTQDYYPLWVTDESLTFSGSCLAPNGIDRSGTGRYYVLYSYPWGYVDNHPNDYADLNSFDIGWAVDADGVPVDLPGADFVRVYTGVNQYCGWLGETSTELSRAQDLHIDLPGIPVVPVPESIND